MTLTDEQRERYARQIVLPEIGESGQRKLMEGSVLIIGAGGLGSPAALYLAAAGVGRIGIADADAVERSNLQRQILHATADLGRPKAVSAAETIRALNPDVETEIHEERVTGDNISELIRTYDFVIDATDNFASKFLINDACVLEDKPFVHAGILGFCGQLMTVLPHRSPCYRCVFRSMPEKGDVPTGRQAGVFGATAGVIGTLEALEAAKYLTGAGDLLTGKLLTFDGLTARFHTVALPPRGEGCAVCSDHPEIRDLTGCYG